MSDRGETVPDALTVDANAGAAMTAGAILRAGRENAGLHIGALAVALKVPVRKLEALEADRLELLPDVVFARALAASVCRTLKLDSGPVLEKLPHQAPNNLLPGARLNHASFDASATGRGLPLLSRVPRPVLVSAGLLIVAALALLFVPSLDRAKLKLESTRVAVSTGDPLAGSAAADPSAGPITSSGVATPSSSSSAATPGSGPLDRGQAPALAPAGLVDSGVSITPANRKVQEPAPGSDLVVFKTRAAAWVEVVDASGVVQLRRTISSGETAVASGALPLSVTVGRVDSIDVLVRGKPYDVSPLARDNVARFQIK